MCQSALAASPEAAASEATVTEASFAAPAADPVGALPVFSADAVAKVGELIAEDGNPNLKLRIYVSGGGCSGFQYGFAFDEEVNEDDFRIDQGGVSLLIDAMSMQYLGGAEVGYEEGLQGSRFVIKNPNATTTCGCGSSFSV